MEKKYLGVHILRHNESHLRCDTIWADAAKIIIIVASRYLSHAKINSPESNAYLITSGWSSQSIVDRIEYGTTFFSLPERYHTLMYISNFTPRRKLLFVPDRSHACRFKFLLLSFVLSTSLMTTSFGNVCHLWKIRFFFLYYILKRIMDL